jgi:hypothetical protein
MEANQYGFQMKIGNGIGYVDNHPVTGTLDALESAARKAFRNPDVLTVCIYDCHGIARRYFKKDADGIILVEKRFVKSPLTRQ